MTSGMQTGFPDWTREETEGRIVSIDLFTDDSPLLTDDV